MRLPIGFFLTFFLIGPAASTLPASSPVRASIQRALPPLQRSAAKFVAERACVSCHHNVLPILMLHLASRRGFDIDASTLASVEDKTFRELRGSDALDNAVQAVHLNDPTPNDSFLLMAANAAGLASDLTTGVYANRLMHWQSDGHWTTSDFRPPHSSSPFTATASAIRAIQIYIPDELASERDAAVLRARQWLTATRPESTEDAAFRLMGLVWAKAAPNEIAPAEQDLLALQQSGGGWAEIPGYEPDAYSTGETLFALHEAGLGVEDSRWQKGLKFLLSTQARDGSWRVRTRMLSPAEISPPYFSTGFPYGKDEFLSYAGSTWAVMAMLSAIPETQTEDMHSNVPATEVPWSRSALFGTPAELKSLLDSGLNPNSTTPGGTTLLMMAASNAEKVQLLVARGAGAKTRAGGGIDALAIAAGYRGTAPSIRSLLDAGAELQVPDGVHVRRAPLVFSSMNGDMENVKLLLSRGAMPSTEALTEAITFGHADVVQTLIRAGANAGITEPSGVNLLHWAAITDRPEMIPLLVEAGVPLNAADNFGFTPLMYAATLDFGNTRVLRELLKAGADLQVRNPGGRTPLEQARHFKHSQLASEIQGRK